MQWHSAADFFAMGGYAVYVWGSVGACALGMAVEPWLLRRRHRQLVAAVRRRRRGAAADQLPGAQTLRQRRRQAA
jgi:heme exporter protein D